MSLFTGNYKREFKPSSGRSFTSFLRKLSHYVQDDKRLGKRMGNEAAGFCSISSKYAIFSKTRRFIPHKYSPNACHSEIIRRTYYIPISTFVPFVNTFVSFVVKKVQKKN
jgi:hypothetical protein